MRVWAGLVAVVVLVEEARGQGGEWEPCDVASCKCAGYCLDSLVGTAYNLSDGGDEQYVVSICQPLDSGADQQGDPAGSLHCEGCTQPSPPAEGQPSPPNCTAVQFVGGTCTGVGTSDKKCQTGFESKCGMSAMRMPGGELKIRYQYEFDLKDQESSKDEFILTLKGGSVKSLGEVSKSTVDGTEQLTSTWELPEWPLGCAGPPEPEPQPEPEPPVHPAPPAQKQCSAVCSDNSLAIRPGDPVTAADAEQEQMVDCCCEGAQGFGVMLFCGIAMFYMFVGLAIVCEEYFVPSLNVLCEKLKMSDDIAGATFMAAGASSPEMFASLIGVMDSSAVGAGTVVGSELFNILVIVGAVCLFTGSAGLMLDWRPLIREVGFFMGSLFLLIFVLWDEEVQFWEGILLVSGYGGYVVVCAQYGFLVKMFCPIKSGDHSQTGGLEQPFLEDSERSQSTVSSRQQQRVTMDGSMFGFEYGQVLMHGFLFKSSRYYTKIRMSGSKWQRRWFILTDDEVDPNTKVSKPTELRYCKNPLFAGRTSSRSIPIKSATGVKRTTPTEFELITPSETFTFKAQKPEMAEAWVEKLEMKVEDILRESSLQQLAEQQQAMEEHPTVLAWPDTSGRRILYICTFPMLVAFYMTIPDVRCVANLISCCFAGAMPNLTGSLCWCDRRVRWTNYYPATMIIAVLYLALLADGMMMAAEKVGCLAGVPEDLMGLTVTAAGTSLPNLFASVLVARQVGNA
eukprot:COSAG02_NODE_349_length_24073_cov_102.816092_26_plen_736_part_00